MGGVDLGQLVDHDHVADEIEPGAAQLFGPRYAEQSQIRHLADVFPWEGGIGVVLRGHRSHFVAREGAHHLARGEMLFSEVKRIVHDRPQAASVSSAARITARKRSPY